MKPKSVREIAKYWMFRMSAYWRYFKRAKTRYDLHSPSIVDFERSVLRGKFDSALESLVLDFRRWYAGREEWIDIPALGAGSWVKSENKRQLKEIVSNSAIDSKEGQLLARLARYTQSKTIVELGTNGGVSTAYLAYGQPQARVITVEGNVQLAHSTRESLHQHQLTDRVELLVGTFSEQLPDLLSKIEQIDLLFVDGDHRYGATLDYVRMCLPKVSRQTVFVIADIRWSAGMEKAWLELQSLPEVCASMATYHFGFLFFNEDMSGLPPLDYIRARYKPWRMGFW
ncbi:MAG: class I SAM-dependent methyltransferase [Bacteroidota bacterium]